MLQPGARTPALGPIGSEHEAEEGEHVEEQPVASHPGLRPGHERADGGPREDPGEPRQDEADGARGEALTEGGG